MTQKKTVPWTTLVERQKGVPYPAARSVGGVLIAITNAGLAFGGTGLCSYRVRGVGGSCAEHLTV